MDSMAKASWAVRELTASDAQLLFQSAKAFVQSVVLGVSGLVGLAVHVGIYVRVVGSLSTDVHLLGRAWRLAKMRMRSAGIHMVS